MLAESPAIGRRYEKANAPDIRRLHLRKTRYHVYYSIDSEAQMVGVVAVWSALRERPPV